MKSFLAGLALGLGITVIFEARRAGGRRRVGGQESAPPAGERKGRDGAMVAPERASRAGESAGAAAATEPAASQPGARRSAEEVLNSATRQQLLAVYGIGPVLADRIIQNRPYAAAYDVVEQGIIPESTFVQLRKQLLEQQSA